MSRDALQQISKKPKRFMLHFPHLRINYKNCTMLWSKPYLTHFVQQNFFLWTIMIQRYSNGSFNGHSTAGPLQRYSGISDIVKIQAYHYRRCLHHHCQCRRSQSKLGNHPQACPHFCKGSTKSQRRYHPKDKSISRWG